MANLVKRVALVIKDPLEEQEEMDKMELEDLRVTPDQLELLDHLESQVEMELWAHQVPPVQWLMVNQYLDLQVHPAMMAVLE